MLPKILPHYQYLHSGEYFSKLLLMNSGRNESENILHVVGNSEIQKKFLSLAKDRNISYTILESYHDLYQLIHGNSRIYSIEIEKLEVFLEKNILQNTLILKKGEHISMDTCLKKIINLGYEFHEYEKNGSFYRSGDTIKLIRPDGGVSTLSFWGDEIEDIWNDSLNVTTLEIPSLEKITDTNGSIHHINLRDYLQESGVHILLDTLEFHYLYESLTHKNMKRSSFDILAAPDVWDNSIDLEIEDISLGSLEEFQNILTQSGTQVHIFTKYRDMLREFTEKNNIQGIEISSVTSHLYKSFRKETTLYICDDIIEKIFIKKRVRKKLSADLDLLLKIQTGDYVVHIDHGIGIFNGIIKKSLGEIEKEYLKISYKENDTLFVPITELQRVSKYVGVENPKLTPLSGKIWERKMQKVHEDIREIAENILKNFAERKLRSGKKNIYLQEKIDAFQDAFPYAYTQDQENSIQDIFSDMQSEKNMDRLLVGDVGFGKTEIAFNAAYLSLLNHKQVILISPLVVLAHEHFEKAKERFSEFGYTIEVLTRLQSSAHATKVLKKLKSGEIDMIIGTHRLLSEKIEYKNLGLMIVDEEHKFGVVDKEKIKNIRNNIDILSLSATPIPRSLNLALSGVRDISLIKTPPSGRKSIKTSVLRYNEKLIQDAGEKEFARGGQVFFVHNRLSNIEVIKKQLQALFPKKKIIITHGQLPGDELENRIMNFKHKKYDILLSTTVIENGIDFSNVNTIFINECQSFGISQIHQLRGRVGRSDAQGYCYLLYRKDHIDGDAAKRMQTIVDYSYLGAGFELAMKDLEIRGGGDILGIRQSGQSQEIGVSLFLKMLEEKIQDLKQQEKLDAGGEEEKKKIQKIIPQIDIHIPASIPDDYFLSEGDKLNFYREIESIEDIQDILYLQNTLFSYKEKTDDTNIENLFLLLEIKILCQKYKISSLKKVGVHYQIDFHQSTTIQELKSFLIKDTELHFFVVTPHRLRCTTKLFANDKIFLQYLLRLLQGNIGNPKIRIKQKAV